MGENKSKKFEGAFTYDQLNQKLAGMTAQSGYSLTKRKDPDDFNRLTSLLPQGYVAKLKDAMESIEFIYSGSAESPYMLTIVVGRNDRFQGTERLDRDVFNIAPDTGATASYMLNQWFHFRDEHGNRISPEIAPFVIGDEEKRKNVTYGTYLTGSTSYYSMADYEQDKGEFITIHNRTFGSIYPPGPTAASGASDIAGPKGGNASSTNGL